MGPNRNFLGASCELGAAFSEGIVVIRPEDTSKEQVIADIAAAEELKYMTSGQASKTRGRSNWIASNTFGRIGRLGVQILKELQYGPRSSSTLSLPQLQQLRFHAEVLKMWEADE